ncbi:hypothetical protein OAA13_01695 [Crocinitomicaceae bacterium]|nr:hypothetical protein [Crocinitomicaceae bacterium]MDC3308632.1 hypothetical protein [Crocinitomicaceae bacterium]
MTTLFFGQEMDNNKECQRMLLFVSQELKMKNYAMASMYYLKGETICGEEYGAKEYDAMSKTLRNTIITEKDNVRKKLYTDTLLGVYDRMDAKGYYNEVESSKRATFIMMSSNPDYKKADEIYLRAFENNNKFNDAELTYYYYNLYTLFSITSGDDQTAFKKRLISDYFLLSKKIESENFASSTQQSLTGYFNSLVRSCDDILPELNGFMSSLPQDKEAKKKAVNNFLKLLKEKGCTESNEYEMLIDTIISIDNTIDAVLAKAQLLKVKKRFKESISVYQTAVQMTELDSIKNEIMMDVLDIQYSNLNAYRTAYNTALTIKGSNRSKALLVAANCVAKTANSCGSSTFERKCNYYYAAQLANQAGKPGVASKFKANAPTADEIFSNNSPATLKLSCWNVTVDVKKN